MDHRQQLTPKRIAVAIAAVAVIVAVASYGIYQVAVALPRQRAAEQRQADDGLRRSQEAARAMERLAAEQHAESARQLRKLSLEKEQVGRRLTPDEAAELRILTDEEARTRVDRLGR